MGSSGGSGVASGAGIASLSEYPAPRRAEGGIYLSNAFTVTTGVCTLSITIPTDSWTVDLAPSDMVSAATVQAALDAVIGADHVLVTDSDASPNGQTYWVGTGDWNFLSVLIEATACTFDGGVVLGETVGTYPQVYGTAGVDPWPALGRLHVFEGHFWISDGYSWGEITPTRNDYVRIGSPGNDYPRTRLTAIRAFKNATLEAADATLGPRAAVGVWAGGERGYVQFEFANGPGDSAAMTFLSGADDPSDGAGVGAEVGSLFFRDPNADGTTGEVWAKTTGEDTGWTKVTLHVAADGTIRVPAAGSPGYAEIGPDGLNLGMNTGSAVNTGAKLDDFSSSGHNFFTLSGENLAAMALGGHFLICPGPTTPTDSVLTDWNSDYFPDGGVVAVWLDTVGNALGFRVRYPDGSFKSGTVALA